MKKQHDKQLLNFALSIHILWVLTVTMRYIFCPKILFFLIATLPSSSAKHYDLLAHLIKYAHMFILIFVKYQQNSKNKNAWGI